MSDLKGVVWISHLPRKFGIRTAEGCRALGSRVLWMLVPALVSESTLASQKELADGL
jgi:hypothetical protein